jgi:hypothetical protein
VREPDETAEPACGTERWAVKVGSDPGARQPMSTVRSTIAVLRALSRPSQLPEGERFPGAETTIYELRDVLLVKVKREADSDAHLVLSDDSGATMVAELADEACVAPASPWRQAIRDARATLAAHPLVHANKTAAFVSLRGVGFFDRLHGQTGMAPNGIELHPVLAICFGMGCDFGAP